MISDNLLNDMRGSRKNPSVLKHGLISIRSVNSEGLIFVFEGVQDIGVYENWISATDTRPRYEPLAGKGKEQLLALHRQLLESNDALLNGVYFFVDCDFDEEMIKVENVFVLEAYSIENQLVARSVIESLICDEFRCCGSPDERRLIVDVFEQIFTSLKEVMSEVNFRLFVARRDGIEVVKKPEHIDEVANIQLTAVSVRNDDATSLVQLRNEPDAQRLATARKEFNSLPDLRAQRGKYVLDAMRQWLRRLTEDRKSEHPILFRETMRGLPGEPFNATLRRLAIPSTKPAGLDRFVRNAAGMDRLD